MSSVPEIPGFYYDAEKRKYFKIESHGNPSNPYSRDNIAKRRKAEEQQIRLAEESRLQAEQLERLRPFQRWTDSTCSVRGYMNSREVGLSKTSEDRENLPMKLMRRKRVWEIHQSQSTLERLSSFALDEGTGEAVLGTYGGLVSVMSTDTKSSNVRLHLPQSSITRFTSRVMSISLSTTNQIRTLVCCSLGNEHNSGTIHVGKFSSADDQGHELEVYAVMRPRKSQALFCTTISRYVPDLFAVGGENVIFVSGDSNEQRPMLNIKSNCLAVEFLGEHTLAAGSRNGVIRLYDFRGQPGLQLTGLKIQHPSSVTQMRQVEDHLLVVNGLQNSLAMYDLRNIRKAVNQSSTIPIVRYTGHVNSVSSHLGFDVSPNRSILAAVGDDRFIRLWSVNTGQRIHARISENAFDDAVIGLQFSREDDGIWIAGQNIEYWSI